MLNDFVRHVVDDLALQQMLARLDRPDDYANAVEQLARDVGIELPREVIARALSPDPLGIGRWSGAPVTLGHWPARGWLPARSVPTGGAPAFDWAYFGPDPVAGPFFEDAVRRASVLPFNQMFRTRTSFETLVEGAREQDAVVPSGLIFHMSRCGSTLVSEMLAAIAGHHVVSEPEPLDAVVQWARFSGAPWSLQVAALRAVVAALGRRGTVPDRFFIKLDSWHTLALPLFRAAFPDVPWLFLYREPIEVVASHQRQPGAQTVPGILPAETLGIVGAANLTTEQYCAAALARICAAVLDHWALGGGLLVSYESLAPAMVGQIPAHFGFMPDEHARAAMQAMTKRHSKDASRPFVPDSADKRHAASSAVVAAAEVYLRPVYAQLEMLRCDPSEGPPNTPMLTEPSRRRVISTAQQRTRK